MAEGDAHNEQEDQELKKKLKFSFFRFFVNFSSYIKTLFFGAFYLFGINAFFIRWYPQLSKEEANVKKDAMQEWLRVCLNDKRGQVVNY